MRQLELPHLVENALYNELVRCGYTAHLACCESARARRSVVDVSGGFIQYIFSYSPFWTFLRHLKPARLAR